MSKRFTKPSIKWADLEKRVPPEQKGSYLAFKGKSDGYLRRVLANPEHAPKINWEEYRKTVPVPGLVDKLKSAYEAFKVPYPEDTVSAKVDEQWKTLQPEIQAFCADRQKEIDAATKEIERVNALPNAEDMTMEMYFDMFPNEALNPVAKPTFWPHTPEEQEGYISPEELKAKEDKK